MKKSVVLRGPCLTSSGYAVHARQIARYLLTKDIDLYVQTVPWGICSWIVDGEKNELIKKIFQRCVPLPEGCHPDVSIQVQLPNEWDPSLAKFNIGVTAAVETDICSSEWVECCNKMDLIIVPSEFTANVLKRSGKLTKPIQVVGESYPDCYDKDESEPSQKVKEFLDEVTTDFNFLVFGQLTGDQEDTDRKGIVQSIKVLLQEFKNDKNVSVVVKTNQGKATTVDRYRTEQALKGIISSVRGDSAYPVVHFIHGDFEDEEICSILKSKKIHATVCATKGEGFGLTLLESARAALPVVATGWSAHTEFMNLGKWVDLTYDLVEIPKSKIDGKIFIGGAKWAKVEDDHLKKRVRKLRESYSIPKEWAISLSKEIQKKYSWSNIEKNYDEILNNILVF